MHAHVWFNVSYADDTTWPKLRFVASSRHLGASHCAYAESDTDLDPTTMSKNYKQLKTQHVSGHVGSSLSDINSVSLAMPVPYMTHPACFNSY